MKREQDIPAIVEALKKASPEKIILFGSFAYGTPTENSDLDLIIITKDEHIPSSFSEKMKLYHTFNPLIREFRKSTPIDLIIYTKGMYQALQERGSMFAREIQQKGKVLYESIN
ncbi:MAG TPA: nucleotidyltransferase domain-containing protein [Prolixibacteraceae bacterium]|nr:nucleotidyltransferase domain-containing protein [Prolixibacteraceae bacterium]